MAEDKSEAWATKMKKRAAKGAVKILLPMVEGKLGDVDDQVIEILNPIELQEGETHKAVLMLPTADNKIICSTVCIKFNKENFRIVSTMSMENLITNIIKMIPEKV